MEEFLAQFDRGPQRATIVEIVESLADQIRLLEFRYRSNPAALDSDSLKPLFRNYYLCIRYGREGEADFVRKPAAPSFPPLEYLILIGLSVPCVEMADRFINTIYSVSPPLFAFAFLRHVALFYHFALDRPVATGSPIDWNAILMYESLCARYSVAARDLPGELPRFSFPPLPPDYLGFMREPYNIDIAGNCHREIGICLLTGGQVLVTTSGPGSGDLRSLPEYLRMPLNAAYTFVLVVTGTRAGSVLIADFEFRWMREIRSCYVDRYGYNARITESGGMLTLSQAQLDALVDSMLSGDWTDELDLETE
jgi:hypothetical protein